MRTEGGFSAGFPRLAEIEPAEFPTVLGRTGMTVRMRNITLRTWVTTPKKQKAPNFRLRLPTERHTSLSADNSNLANSDGVR